MSRYFVFFAYSSLQRNDAFFRSLTRQLPYNLPFSVKVGLFEQCFDEWHLYATQCFDSVRLVASKQLGQLIEEHFKPFSHSGLKEQVRYGSVDDCLNCAVC